MDRAQAAAEFIMTYGWAIMVVLMAIGVLAYFGVLGPMNQNKCTFNSELFCTEKPHSSANMGGSIIFPLVNYLPYDVENVTAFSDNCLPSPEISIKSQESGVIILQNCGFSEGDKYREFVTVRYTASESSGGSGMWHTTFGEVSGVSGS